MSTCFIIQPFDKGKFDRRYSEVYEPAITECGLTPYRVDQDPSVQIPIVDIEEGIRDSTICLADITIDNPNVWFELGFAISAKKPVVMVCSSERTTKFPFDVQHRSIIIYKIESPSDFESLKQQIVERIHATLKKAESLQFVASGAQVSIEGLAQHELIVLAALAGNLNQPAEIVSTTTLKRDVTASGFTSLAYTIGLKLLTDKGLIRYELYQDYHDNEWWGYLLTDAGWDWIMKHQDSFAMRQSTKLETDDIPF